MTKSTKGRLWIRKIRRYSSEFRSKKKNRKNAHFSLILTEEQTKIGWAGRSWIQHWAKGVIWMIRALAVVEFRQREEGGKANLIGVQTL